jgi:hypothetical protein
MSFPPKLISPIPSISLKRFQSAKPVDFSRKVAAVQPLTPFEEKT